LSQTSPANEPVEVVSITGPLSPINPGGPVVEIILNNTGGTSIVSLTATLDIPNALSNPFVFTFNVTPANPLLPGDSVSDTLTLING
jgi:hypothetical protein